MNKYQIRYTNAQGREITAISRADTAREAAEKYAARVHWWDFRLKLCDAETRGVEAAEGYFLISGPADNGPYAEITKVKED